jgi:hypothetical protein
MKMAVKASPASRTLPATLATVRVVTVQPMGFHLEHLPNEKSGACSHPYVRPLCVTATINGSKLQVKSSGGETCESSPSPSPSHSGHHVTQYSCLSQRKQRSSFLAGSRSPDTARPVNCWFVHLPFQAFSQPHLSL